MQVKSIARRIVDFHQDEERHWVARLECGHDQHVRHDPPWKNRPWVTTEQGRREHLGATLHCVKCAEADGTSHEADSGFADDGRSK